MRSIVIPNAGICSVPRCALPVPLSSFGVRDRDERKEPEGTAMTDLLLKAAISGLLVAFASRRQRRSPPLRGGSAGPRRFAAKAPVPACRKRLLVKQS